METIERFRIADCECEIRISTVIGGPEWYEIWMDGNVISERVPWPVDPKTQLPLTKNKLLREVQQFLLEQAAKRRES
jgi:hypothetical protein